MRNHPKKNITHTDARKLFYTLIEELQKSDRLNKQTFRLVDDMVLLEQIKQKCYEDVMTRGVMELFENGKQVMYRENKSVDKILKIVEQQRKLQAELKLTPASDKKVSKAVGPDDDFDNF
ncbi:MAG: P27 family phage terminase small subunit [Victivallales bacterium]